MRKPQAQQKKMNKKEQQTGFYDVGTCNFCEARLRRVGDFFKVSNMDAVSRSDGHSGPGWRG